MIAALLFTLALAACGSTPKPADPPRVRAALEAESDGAKRYERGDYALAARRFEEASRLFTSIDDAPAALRNRLHLARSELGQGRADAALAILAGARDGGPEHALDILLLTAQAQLAQARADEALKSLVMAAARCNDACPQAASLRLLRARATLAAGRAGAALQDAEAGLKLLQDKAPDADAEAANAWRIVGAARLAAGDAAGALPAARNALDIDRRLALPEKIARDWLLIGDIQAAAGSAEAAAAYLRALDIANAAGLTEITRLSTQALSTSPVHK